MRNSGNRNALKQAYSSVDVAGVRQAEKDREQAHFLQVNQFNEQQEIGPMNYYQSLNFTKVTPAADSYIPMTQDLNVM